MIQMTCFSVARWLLAVVSLVSFSGCQAHTSTDEETEVSTSSMPTRKVKVDSWLHSAPSPPPPSGQTGGATELTKTEIYEVTDTAEPQAEVLLQQLSIVPLSFQQASAFTAGQFKGAATTSPYLVRALYLNKETGGFSVSQYNNSLFVEHSSLGKSDVPIKRTALIVQLRSIPSEVFVSCSMAE